MPSRFRRLLYTTFALFPALSAHACTVCNSEKGHQLRAGLFNGHFLHTFGTVALPVPVLAAAVYLLHRWMPILTFEPPSSLTGGAATLESRP